MRSREGFVYRGVKLYNCIPSILRQEKDIKIFKKQIVKWVCENIEVKPTSRFPALPRGRVTPRVDMSGQQITGNPQINDITRYFQPI